MHLPSVYPYECGVCLFPFRQSRAPDEINDELHTFFVYPRLGVSRENVETETFNYLKYSYRMRQKELYEAPEIEVLELRLEGVIAMSNFSNGEGMDDDD